MQSGVGLRQVQGELEPASRAESDDVCDFMHAAYCPGISTISREKRITMGTYAPRNVVLVHGGFVDGSGWQGVYESLSRDGYRVSIVQNPTLSLEGDVDATRRIIDAQDGPVVLVGHSYGGAVITEAGTHPNVAALVYIAAFAPDKGESVSTLIAGFPADGPQPPILPPRDGFLFLDRDKFHASFAADLPAEPGRVHGRLAGPLGGGRPRRSDHRPGLADQAQLVPGHHRGPDDPAAGAARHGRDGSAPPCPRSRPATPSTCRSQRRWPRSSRRPRPAPPTGRHHARRLRAP